MVEIPDAVAKEIGYYVYLLVNPLDDAVFYVGKGKGNRALDHFAADGDSRKDTLIREIEEAGQRHQIEILAHGISDSDTAYRIEAAAIDLFGIDNLTNAVRGRKSLQYGRMSLHELVVHYRKKPVTIREPALLIRINRLYRYGISPTELYDATRGVWKIGPRRNRAKYAFAVYDGIVREVYAITAWFPAGSSFSTRDPQGLRRKGRWEFVGTLAPEKIRKRYLDGYVGEYITRGARNPITYVNVD